MEDKQEKRIRLLSKEVDRLTSENEVLKKENAELQTRINELSSYGNVEKMETIKEYEQKSKDMLEKVRRLRSLYEQLIDKQKRYIEKEEIKYQKATNKAIADFVGALRNKEEQN